MTTTNVRLLLTGALSALLIGCGGGASDAPTATPAPPASGKLTLSGIVTDNPIVNASVMVRVADTAFDDAPPTGSNGEFSLEISSENPEALIMAEALDSVNGVKLSAVLDTYEGFTSQARNGVVDGIKITNVTTALQVLAESVAADGSIDTFSEYEQLVEQVDAGTLFELSAAIKVVVENIDGNVLPAGVNDTIELARAISGGSSSFLNDIAISSPNAMAEARSKLLTDGNATLPFGPTDAPGVYRSVDENFIYAVFANGTALVDNLDDNEVPGTPSWSLNDNGQLVVRFFGFERATDSLSVIGKAGDVMHVVRESDFGTSTTTDANTTVKHLFGTAYSDAVVPGTWTDSATPDSEWVFIESGAGFRRNLQTQVQSDAFSWTITDDGRVNMDFDGTDESMQFVKLSTGDDALQVTRFNGQYAYLALTELTKN